LLYKNLNLTYNKILKKVKPRWKIPFKKIKLLFVVNSLKNSKEEFNKNSPPREIGNSPHTKLLPGELAIQRVSDGQPHRVADDVNGDFRGSFPLLLVATQWRVHFDEVHGPEASASGNFLADPHRLPVRQSSMHWGTSSRCY